MRYLLGVMLAATPAPTFLLIDDHALFRTGLRMLLADGWSGVKLVELDSMEALMAAPVLGLPELILLDVTLPGIHGLAGLAWLRERFGSVPVLMLSARDDEQVVAEARRLGANGFVSKSASPDVLVAALRLASDGQEVWPEEPQPAANLGGPWSPSQQQQRILSMLGSCKSNKALARALSLPENLVRAELSVLMERLGVISRAAVLQVAQQQGWVGETTPQASALS
jgi:two-component system, NarL family, nitrate/nitrite response regulator NarL